MCLFRRLFIFSIFGLSTISFTSAAETVELNPLTLTGRRQHARERLPARGPAGLARVAVGRHVEAVHPAGVALVPHVVPARAECCI